MLLEKNSILGADEPEPQHATGAEDEDKNDQGDDHWDHINSAQSKRIWTIKNRGHRLAASVRQDLIRLDITKHRG